MTGKERIFVKHCPITAVRETPRKWHCTPAEMAGSRGELQPLWRTYTYAELRIVFLVEKNGTRSPGFMAANKTLTFSDLI